MINSYEDAKKAVRQRYKNGADVIKITATGGVLSVAKDGQGPQFQMDELKGIVEIAKEYGFLPKYSIRNSIEVICKYYLENSHVS